MKKLSQLIQIYVFICLVFWSFISCQTDTRRLNPNPIHPERTIAVSTKTHSYVIQYGYVGNRLAYVVFSGLKNNGENNIVEGLVTMGSHKSYITKPSGAMVQLPSDVQLFECIDGKYAESKERVSKEAFEAFLASDPKEYTINALLKFSKKEKEEG
jgi:hypothetical protein